MKKINFILFMLLCIVNINFNNTKTIITESKEYYSIPSTCTEANNCEKLLINNPEWFKTWRESEATRMPDGQTRSYANVLFAVDVSGSMQNNTQLSYIDETIQKFVNALHSEDMIGIANYAPFLYTDGINESVKFQAIMRKNISKDKTYDYNMIVYNGTFPPTGSESAFKYLSSKMVPTSQWSYDIIIWLTDSMDHNVFETIAGGESLLDYGIKLYIVNIGNDHANINYFGEKTKQTLGKYYFIDISEPITEIPKEEDEVPTIPPEPEIEEPTCVAESDNFCDCLIRLFIFLGHIMNIIKITVPIIIILMGSIDLIKAIVYQNDDQIQQTKKIFVKRLIYGVAVFFVISVVSFLIGLVGGDTNNRCFKCVADVNGEVCNKEHLPKCCRNSNIESVPKEEPQEDEVPKEEESIPEKKEPNLEGWSCSDVNTAPIEGCRVHFSDIVIGMNQKFFTLENSNYPNSNDILGKGKYSSSTIAAPNSTSLTLDSFVIDKNTKLIFYDQENFKGQFFEKEGPLLLYSGNNDESIFNSWVNNSLFSNNYNGLNFPYERSPQHMYGEYNAFKSFMICCKN
ncbi:MAG: VWA domain-containing protein [Bacilli bacterium]|nr:VWA domain-containing protein [Bacilli bacterium]